MAKDPFDDMVQASATFEEKVAGGSTQALEHRESFDSVTREAIGGHSVEELPKHYYRSPRFLGSFVSFALGYESGFMGYVMSANVLTIINADLGPNRNINWVLLVFVLCQTVSFTIAGRLSDIFGRRYYMIGANAFAMVGYLVSGRAKSVNVLIGANVLSGLGTGIHLSGSIYMGELVPNKHRFIALGVVWALLAPISTICPGLARIMVDHTEQSWRWVYYLVCIMSGVAAILQLFCYFPPDFHLLHQKHTKFQALKGFDYGGVIIFTGSITSLLLGISWGGQQYPWRSAQVIVTIVVGGVGFIGFLLYEKFYPLHHPLMPLHFFKNANFIALTACASIACMIYYALNIVWPQQIAALFGASVQKTGWISCTLTAGVVFGQILGGICVRVIGKTKWQLVICCVLFTAFIGGMAGVNRHREGMAIAFSLISSAMVGYMEVICLAGAPLTMDPNIMGLATGIMMTVRSGCSVLADSIYVTILQNKLSSNLPKYIAPAAVKAGLPESSIPELLVAISTGDKAALATLPGLTPKIIAAVTPAALTAFEKSFQVIYLASISFGGVAIIAALCSTNLDQRMTTDIARKLQGVQGSPTVTEEKLSAIG